MKTIKIFAALLLALILCLSTNNALAQAKNLAKIYYVQVKAGHEAEFGQALAQHAQWRRDQGDPWTWHVYEIANGQSLGNFVIRSGNHSWADLDSYEDFLAKGAVEWNKNVAPHTSHISSSISALDTTNVNWYPNDEELNLFSITTYHLKPGQDRVFAQAVNKIHTAIMQHKREAYYAFAWQVNGGMGPAVSLVLPYKNWAHMQGPDESFLAFLTRAMGADESQKVLDQFSSTYNSVETMILHLRRDLSVIPGT